MVKAIIKTVTNCAALNWFRALKRFNSGLSLANDCERCYLSTASWAVSSMRLRGERYIFFKLFSTNIGMESILTQRNSTKKSLFYRYANFVAKRLLMTNKKQNFMNSTQKLMDIKLRFFFKWKFILYISNPFLFCRYLVHVITQSNE